jgi:hypothetical protein
MSLRLTVLAGLAAFFFLLSGGLSRQSSPVQGQAAEKPAKAKYVGVANCKLCHSEDETGNQYAHWEKSKHASALKTLSTPEAKALGAKVGVANPSKDIKCLKCHVTAAEEPKSQKLRTFKDSAGVGCESCHGAGEHYAKKEVFEQGKEAAIKLGLIEPTEEVCKRCHNKESPSYKDFDFKKRFEEIKHPNPKKKK